MPKMKTKKAIAKRFKVTATGKIFHNRAYKSHLLGRKNKKRKRRLRKRTEVDFTDFRRVKVCLPYG